MLTKADIQKLAKKEMDSQGIIRERMEIRIANNHLDGFSQLQDMLDKSCKSMKDYHVALEWMTKNDWPESRLGYDRKKYEREMGAKNKQKTK